MLCPKCGYIRKHEDIAPEWQCPSCQVVYAKVSANNDNQRTMPIPNTISTPQQTGTLQSRSHILSKSYEQPEKQRPLQWRYISLGVFVLLVIIAMNTEIKIAMHDPSQINPQATSVELINKKDDDVHVTEVFDYFDVTGLSEIELNRHLDENNKLFIDGKQYSAMVFYTITWRPYARTGGELCSLDKVDVMLDVKFHMPRWINQSSSTPNLQSYWTQLYGTLLDHENGHRDLALEEAREIQRKIKEIAPTKNCQELSETADKIGYSLISKYSQLQLNYDECTKHGLEQNKLCR